jgi:hypothetical protein
MSPERANECRGHYIKKIKTRRLTVGFDRGDCLGGDARMAPRGQIATYGPLPVLEEYRNSPSAVSGPMGGSPFVVYNKNTKEVVLCAIQTLSIKQLINMF